MEYTPATIVRSSGTPVSFSTIEAKVSASCLELTTLLALRVSHSWLSVCVIASCIRFSTARLGSPRWKLYAIQSWDTANYGIALTERWFSHGVFGHQYVVCQSNCPISTVNNPTIDHNEMAGALYFDLGGYYSVSDKLTGFVKVDNLLDRDPAASPQTNTGLDINPALYDTIGRTYRAGLRYNF